MTTPAPRYMPPCAICGQPCDLETCKADWMGKAVHEECLAKALALPKRSLYVEGEAPMAVTPATAYFAKGWNLVGWREAARGHSADASLLYAVGDVTDTKKNSRHAYVQIWRYDPRIANWGLRVLLLTPLSPAK